MTGGWKVDPSKTWVYAVEEDMDDYMPPLVVAICATDAAAQKWIRDNKTPSRWFDIKQYELLS
jgi:hypothetical protein